MAAELDKMKAEYEVVVGDWNVRHPEGQPSKTAAGRRNTAMVRRFAQSRAVPRPEYPTLSHCTDHDEIHSVYV